MSYWSRLDDRFDFFRWWNTSIQSRIFPVWPVASYAVYVRCLAQISDDGPPSSPSVAHFAQLTRYFGRGIVASKPTTTAATTAATELFGRSSNARLGALRTAQFVGCSDAVTMRYHPRLVGVWRRSFAAGPATAGKTSEIGGRCAHFEELLGRTRRCHQSPA